MLGTDRAGWPDFYPSRPGFHQPEDVLTEENVKNGFVAKSYLHAAVSAILYNQTMCLADEQAETFSMHGPIFHFLCNGGLDTIMRVGQEVVDQRDRSMPQLG